MQTNECTMKLLSLIITAFCAIILFQRLFLHNEYFGELLYYKCMGESDTKLSTDSVMTKHQFVMCGANILQLANMQEQIDFYFTMFVAKKPSLSCQGACL